MKRLFNFFVLVFLVSFLVGCNGVVPEPPIEPEPLPIVPPSDFLEFIGVWINIDPNADNVTKIQIIEVGNNVSVEQWGKAHPDDSYLGLILVDKKEITNKSFKLPEKVELFLCTMEEEFFLEEDKLKVITWMNYSVSWVDDYETIDYFYKQKQK